MILTRCRVFIPHNTTRTRGLNLTWLTNTFLAVIVIRALWFRIIRICVLLLGQHFELFQYVPLFMRWWLLLRPCCTCWNLRSSIIWTLSILIYFKSANLLLGKKISATRLLNIELYLLLFANARLVAQRVLLTTFIREELLVFRSHYLRLLRFFSLMFDHIKITQYLTTAGLIINLVIYLRINWPLVFASIRVESIL